MSRLDARYREHARGKREAHKRGMGEDSQSRRAESAVDNFFRSDEDWDADDESLR